MSPRTGLAVLAAACVVALVLRIIGLQYGLPAVYNPDEVAIMARALGFARGTLNPQNFLYPTFFFYVLFAWVGLYLAWVWLSGNVASLTALQQLYYTDPTGIYTAGRALGVLAGTATIALVYRLAARLTDTRTAIGAAILLAVAPLHVRDSHYVKHDVPATLAIVAAYLCIARIWPATRPEGPTMRETIVAGFACGAAFSTHYYCVFLAVPLVLAIANGWRKQGWDKVTQQVAIAGLAMAGAFFALSPFLLVEPLTAWRDITANRQIVVDRAVATGAFGPAGRYLDMLLRDAIGPLAAVLGLVGVIWMTFAAPARALFLLAFPVPFLMFIANTAPASRYLNPVLPFVTVFAAWTIAKIAAAVGRAGAVAFWVGIAAASTPALMSSVTTVRFLRMDDTRTLARHYIEAHIPDGTTILTQPYSAALTPSRAGLVEALTHNLGSADAASIKFRIQLALDPYPSPSYRQLYLGRGGLDAEKIYVDPTTLGGPEGLAPLRRLGVAYVLVTRYNKPDPGTLPFLAALTREGRRVAEFSPYRQGVSEATRARVDPFLHNTDARIDEALERPGPPLEIWQLNAPGTHGR